MARGLSPRQRDVLDFITSCIDRDDLPPTVREVCTGCQIRSTNGVSDHIRALVRKGYLTYTGYIYRGLWPTRYSDGRQFPRRRELLAAVQESATQPETPCTNP